MNLFKANRSITAKLLLIFLLCFILQIALWMIGGVLEERLSLRDQAVTNISSSWGQAQTLTGPILVLPYQYESIEQRQVTENNKIKTISESRVVRGNAYFLPDELSIDGKVQSDTRSRGIYHAVVYRANLELSGNFASPNFKELNIREKDILWDKAFLSLGISDLRGSKEIMYVNWNGEKIMFQPATNLPVALSGIHAPLENLSTHTGKITFSMMLPLNGSNQINFNPVGKKTLASLSANWPSPSFNGSFLPTERRIDSQNFTARWEIPLYGRDYPQSWVDWPPKMTEQFTQSQFGVSFAPEIDSYRNVERSIKYGILFIVLTFATFFLFEILVSLKIHFIQYGLVGTALCLFYLGLLSLSEFTAFSLAYLGSALLCTSMISLYSLKVLKSGKRTLLLALGISGIYSFLYVILQLEQYSLLVGTLGLFVSLGIVMYTTRNVDWSGEA